MACTCAPAHPGASMVALLDGSMVCSWSAAWLGETRERETTARAILRMPDRDTRRAHLDALESRHGAEYRRRLSAVVLGLWERSRAATIAATA